MNQVIQMQQHQGLCHEEARGALLWWCQDAHVTYANEHSHNHVKLLDLSMVDVNLEP